MSAQLGEVTRQQLPQLKMTIADFAALQSVSFKGVGQASADIYEANSSMPRQNGESCSALDGKTQTLFFRPL